jgi:adenylate cyclase class 2
MVRTDFIEIEVKFFLADPQQVKRTLLGLGAKPSERVFETNVRYEDANASFIRRKMLLRLRRTDTKTTLTLKSRPPKPDPDFKMHRELEVEVSDFDTMDAILKDLGYRQAQCYEKWRQTLALGDVTVCLDSLPFGDFLEIEGPKPAIPKLARRIGLAWRRRILFNYLEIFEALKQAHHLPFTDVTFENFRNASVAINALLHRFEGRNVACKS